MGKRVLAGGSSAALVAFALTLLPAAGNTQIGVERSTYQRLEDGEEFSLSARELIAHGQAAFVANWTPAEGGGHRRADRAAG